MFERKKRKRDQEVTGADDEEYMGKLFLEPGIYHYMQATRFMDWMKKLTDEKANLFLVPCRSFLLYDPVKWPIRPESMKNQMYFQAEWWPIGISGANIKPTVGSKSKQAHFQVTVHWPDPHTACR
ncbi:hypothetical protein TWF192_003042 [Orbilia oligospora]|uniref:Uncharacterized protein n=1 Tax=Orbilia oligospora TaxID=2813651 RepID=A0A6G1MDL1_ORBOL|nr:hypothetical protein TWF679_008616 [Orbilia oligospora]KAF3218534.1 hypothetical protein TWF191_008204 [Orbilia oligospora]KAF3254961.1 hypothetical protein TWF192_003042 [Orbilia oligospora]